MGPAPSSVAKGQWFFCCSQESGHVEVFLISERECMRECVCLFVKLYFIVLNS